MAIILDWKIRATNARCELTGEEFVDGQEFCTCIFVDSESDGFLRKDYSDESWEKIHDELDPAPFSFWKSTYKAPVLEADDKGLADTSVEGMLRRFIDEDDPKTEHARYILALMLERKKALVPTDVKDTETRRLLFYEHVDTGDVFIVADPQLKLDEIEIVQAEVAELLAAEEGETASGKSGEESAETGDSGSEESETVEEELEELSDQEAEETEEGGEESSESEEQPVA